MRKILVITTKGCKGCDIIKRNVKDALLQTTKQIIYETKDFNDCEKKFLQDNKVKDFPTTMFIIDDIINYKSVGTYPTAVILRWIDLYL